MLYLLSTRTARAVLLAAACAVTLIGFRSGLARLADFAGYYGGARLLLAGTPPASLYDDRVFTDGVAALGIDEPTLLMYVNPPTVLLPFLPLTPLAPFAAKAVWLSLTALVVLAAWRVALSAAGARAASAFGLLAAALMFCSLPYLRNLQLGQLYGLMLLMFAGAWLGMRKGNHLLTALCLGAAFALKFYGWLFPVYFLVQRRVRPALMTAGAMAVFTGAAVAAFGPEAYLAQISRVAGMTGASDTASLSLRSMVAPLSRLFVHDPRYNPAAVADLPWIPVLVPLLLLAVMFAVTAARTRNLPAENMTGFAAVMVLSVLFTPLAADHHYLLLALPALIPGTAAMRPGSSARDALIPVALLLTFGWLPSPPAHMLEGWGSLLAYWRTAGAVLLWWLLVGQAARTGFSPTPAAEPA